MDGDDEFLTAVAAALKASDGTISFYSAMSAVVALTKRLQTQGVDDPAQGASLWLVREAAVQGMLTSANTVKGISVEQKVRNLEAAAALAGIEVVIRFEDTEDSKDQAEQPSEHRQSEKPKSAALLYKARQVIEHGSNEEEFRWWMPTLSRMLDQIATTEPKESAHQAAMFACKLLLRPPQNRTFEEVFNVNLLDEVLDGYRHKNKQNPLWPKLRELLKPFGAPKDAEVFRKRVTTRIPK